MHRSRLLLAHQLRCETEQCEQPQSSLRSHSLPPTRPLLSRRSEPPQPTAWQPLAANSHAAAKAPLKMATSAELYASAQILGTECADANMAFLKCKAEAQHPRHCLEAGTAVTSCGDGLIARLKSTSGAEFEAFRACLADTNNAFDKCRAQKEALHAAFSAAR